MYLSSSFVLFFIFCPSASSTTVVHFDFLGLESFFDLLVDFFLCLSFLSDLCFLLFFLCFFLCFLLRLLLSEELLLEEESMINY